MGKKDHQRTKGNTKPSSSARSAQLLAASGARTGFIGFGSSSPLPHSSTDNPTPSFVPILDSESFGADDASSAIPGDIRGALRKMGKKDAITKQKAVGEFCSLCEAASAETVLAVLPFWPRIYNKIAVDNDRRVREAAQRANLKVVTSVGKALAPYLKSLMPAWFLSQHDPHAPAAASTARRALAEAFPASAKREEAVTFCRKEILDVVRENLVEQTPQTMSDPSTTSVEDMESKYNRTIAASLIGFADLLRLLRAAADTKTDGGKIFDAVNAYLGEMAKCAKFWKFGSSKVPMVRQSFYTLIVATLTQFSSADAAVVLFGPLKLVAATFARMDGRSDADPLALCSVWDACLAAAARWKDWHAHAGLEKTVVPKVQSLLRRGPSTVPSEIYPKVLPFLGRLPRESLGVHGNAILSALKVGIEAADEDEGGEKTRAKEVIKSDSAVAAYFECAAFVATRAGVDVAAPLIQGIVDAVMGLLEREVSRGGHKSVRVFSAFAEKFLGPISSRGELSEVVWRRLNAQVRYFHETMSDGDSCRLDTLLELIRSISGRRRDSAKRKERGGVRFGGEEKEGNSDVKEIPQVHVPGPGGTNERRTAEMAASLAAASLLKSTEDGNHSRFAIELVETLADEETFYRFLNKRLKTPNSGDSEAFSFLRHWIFEDDASERRITRGPGDLSRLGVTVYSTIKSKSERVAFFKRINSMDDAESAAAFFADLCRNFRVSKGSREDAEAAKWLASNDLGGRLVSLLDAEMAKSGDEGTSGSTKTELALTIADNGDFISEANLIAIYASLTAGLIPDLDHPAAFDRSVNFACDIMNRLAERNKLAFVAGEAADLVVKLMSLDCKFGTERDEWLSTEGTRRKLRNCWRTGFAAHLHNLKGEDPEVENLLFNCAGLVRNCIQLSSSLPAAHEVEHLAQIAKIITESVLEDADSDITLNRWHKTIREMFPPPREWAEIRETESGRMDRMRSILLESPAESVAIFREDEVILGAELSPSPNCRHIAFAYLFDLIFEDSLSEEACNEPVGDSASMDNYSVVFEKPAALLQEEGMEVNGRHKRIPLVNIEFLFELVSEFLNSATFAAIATLTTPDVETVGGKMAERVRRRKTFLQRLDDDATDAILRRTEEQCLVDTSGWCRSLHYLLSARKS